MTKLPKPRRRRETDQIRVIGGDGTERIVAPGQLETENGLRRRREANEMRRQQELFALRPGEVITVRPITATLSDPQLRWYVETGLWWFTARVNGPERTVTAKTMIVERERKEDFPLDVIRTYSLASPGEIYEADRYRSVLGVPVPARHTRTLRQDAPLISASRLSRRQRDLLGQPGVSCIGYMNGCTCDQCKAMDRLAA